MANKHSVNNQLYIFMSVATFIEYLKLEKNYSKLTVQAYHNDIETFKDFVQSEFNITLHEVSYSQIRHWIVNMVEAGLSNRSINRKLSTLNTYYRFLMKVEALNENPMSKHRALKTSKKVQVPFSEQEIENVLKNFDFYNSFEDIRDKLIIELFYSTGIRRIELVALKLSNIDLANSTLKVLGKRNKERVVPLLSSVKKTLKHYIEARNDMVYIKDTDHFFLTKKGVKIYETLVYRIINSYFSKVSTKVKTSPHILRHSFATHLLNQGADINAVKELLGHTSLAATQVYTHSSIAELKKIHLVSHPRSKKKT